MDSDRLGEESLVFGAITRGTAWVYGMVRRWVENLTLGLTLLIASCSSSDHPSASSTTTSPTQAAAAPQTMNESPRHETSPIVAESSEWSAEEALANLGDAQLGVSAAVRLAELTGAGGPYTSTPLQADFARKLRLVELGDGCFALGQVDSASERRLHDVLVMDSAGNVTRVNEGKKTGIEHRVDVRDPVRNVSDEVDPAKTSRIGSKRESGDASGGPFVLNVSRDSEVFPHLFIGPKSVFLAPRIDSPALTLKLPDSLRFELKEESLHSYLALILNREGGGVVEVARYNWDPFEAMFQGPAADKLPDPPGGRFELDVDASERLQPVGGEISDPDPVKPEKPVRKDPS